eukprot:GHUV01028874.1.p1 GENE.GHUV01028874.1~~GHUV01028874.1.p1  ORF type:complete len:100 (+),score=12.97 GHUV01028874.1:684-983(+)
MLDHKGRMTSFRSRQPAVRHAVFSRADSWLFRAHSAQLSVLDTAAMPLSTTQFLLNFRDDPLPSAIVATVSMDCSYNDTVKVIELMQHQLPSAVLDSSA